MATASSELQYWTEEKHHESRKVINQSVSNEGAAAADRERAGTHSNVAVRLDLIDPEAFINQGARSAEQFFELPEGERSHLHHSHSTLTPVFKQSVDAHA